MSSRESTIFVVWTRSSEGQKLALRADQFNSNFEEVCNGKALYDGSIIARHLDPATISVVTGIRAGAGVCSSVNGETTITFSSVLPSVNYAVSFSFESAPVGGLTFYIKSKTVNGFVVAILDVGSNPVDCSSVNLNFSWTATKNI